MASSSRSRSACSARSDTAASALRDASAWSWDDNRRFDAEDWWWRTTVPHGGVLCFAGLATLATVTLNGETILTSDNMFLAHEVAIHQRQEQERAEEGMVQDERGASLLNAR